MKDVDEPHGFFGSHRALYDMFRLLRPRVFEWLGASSVCLVFSGLLQFVDGLSSRLVEKVVLIFVHGFLSRCHWCLGLMT